MAVADPTAGIESIHHEIVHFSEILAYLSEVMANMSYWRALRWTSNHYANGCANGLSTDRRKLPANNRKRSGPDSVSCSYWL